MTEPRALPRVLDAWRQVKDGDPLVIARCNSCERPVGIVYDSNMGPLLHYFQPLAGHVANINVAADDRDRVHEFVTEEHAELYGIKWNVDQDRAFIAGLSDEGWLAILDDDDYWVPGDWACKKHGAGTVDRAILMDRVRRARSAREPSELRVSLSRT